jgi:hypothetical protein
MLVPPHAACGYAGLFRFFGIWEPEPNQALTSARTAVTAGFQRSIGTAGAETNEPEPKENVMKAFSVVALMVGALLVAGCKEGNTATNAAGHGFELNDVTDQSVSQADTDSVKVSVDRKGGFDGPITIEVMGLPAGVTVDGGNTHTILAKDSTITLKLMASDTAAPSNVNAITLRASANVDGQNLSKQDTFNLKVKSRT